MENQKGVFPIYKIIDKDGNILVCDRIVEYREDINQLKLKEKFLTYDKIHLINPLSNNFIIVKDPKDAEVIPFDINNFLKYKFILLDKLIYLKKSLANELDAIINKYDIFIDRGSGKVYKTENDNIYKVVDKNGKVLINDKEVNSKVMIFNHKINIPFPSFDGKYYFNSYQDKFQIYKSDEIDKVIPFDINNMKDYKIVELRDLSYVNNISKEDFEKEIKKYDIIFDYSIEMLDPEVESLVKALNNCGLDLVTKGSCCGHGVGVLWVTIEFQNYFSIRNLALLISTEFNCDFKFSTRNVINLMGMDSVNFILRLETTAIGEEAYKVADRLAEALHKYKSKWKEN